MVTPVRHLSYINLEHEAMIRSPPAWSVLGDIYHISYWNLKLTIYLLAARSLADCRPRTLQLGRLPVTQPQDGQVAGHGRLSGCRAGEEDADDDDDDNDESCNKCHES